MSILVGTNPSQTAVSTSDPYKQRTAQDIKNECAGIAAKQTANAIRIQKQKANQKKKKLNYNYKKISRQITMNNTSTGARRVITKAREEVVSLLRKQMSGKYDETDLRHAIIHARKMERIARRKETFGGGGKGEGYGKGSCRRRGVFGRGRTDEEARGIHGESERRGTGADAGVDGGV